MISNYNDSATQEHDERRINTGSSSGARSTSEVLGSLERRRINAINGGTNCIPLPFKRFRREIPGVEQGQYVLISSNQKIGKSQFTSFVYIYHVLDYCFEHKDQCSCHIIYFSLEESIERVIERYMSHLLYKLDGLRYSPSDLRSTSQDNPIPQKVLDLLNSEKYQERLKFFEECVQFDIENTNPTGVLRVCEEYAKSVGEYKSHKIPSKANFTKEIEVFDSYTQNDPNHYKIVIVDHVSLLDKEQGFKTKDSIDKMSEYFVKYLRNRYNYTCVAIQQQSAEVEGLEAQKQRKMVPSSSSLSDSRYTAKDANVVFGLFDPAKFGLPSWLGYKIQDESGTGLRTYARFLYVLENRDGEKGGICPLFFDGAVCDFEELPKPEDSIGINAYYNKVKNLREGKQKKLSLFFLSLFRK